jgi:TetR/AcrR family transcriptional regulator
MRPELEGNLKPLFDEKCALISNWIDQGRLPALDPRHLLFSIWASTQHYADFETQVSLLMGEDTDIYTSASQHLDAMFRGLLTA